MKISLLYVFLFFLFGSSYSSQAQGPVASAKELPKSFPTPWAEAVETFEVHPDFKIEIVAHEPEVVDPIAMTFDNLGRMYVIEMRGYSERREQMLGRIKLLEDLDHDGIFEKSTIYADQFKWPTAIIWWNGGIFLAATPDIYWLKDTNRDGKADIQTKIFTGFGSDKNKLNVQALVNSFRWGIDNRIYGATAGNGGTIQKVGNGNGRPLKLYNRDFSFDPRNLDIRTENVTAQYGMSFDKWGRKYTCSSSDHIQAIIHNWHQFSSKKSIATDGAAAEVYRISGDEPWREIRTRWRIAGAVGGPVEGGGRVSGYFTAATGLTIYKGHSYGPEWSGSAFIADAGSNLVHVKEISSVAGNKSASRQSGLEKSEFIASRDNWFRPVQFENGPDGCIYIADMYRETIEHPWSLPPGIKNFLDLNNGNQRGRIYRVVPKINKEKKKRIPKNLKNEELISFLSDKDYWARSTAAKLLSVRAPKEITDLLDAKIFAIDSFQGNINNKFHHLMVRNSLKPLERSALSEVAKNVIRQKPNEWDEFLSAFLNYFTSPAGMLSNESKCELLINVFNEIQLELLDDFHNFGFQLPLIYGLGGYSSELEKVISLLPYSNLGSSWIVEAYSNVLAPHAERAAMMIISSEKMLEGNNLDRLIDLVAQLGKKSASSIKDYQNLTTFYRNLKNHNNLLITAFISGLLEKSSIKFPPQSRQFDDVYQFASSQIDRAQNTSKIKNECLIKFLALYPDPEKFIHLFHKYLSEMRNEELTGFFIKYAQYRKEKQVFDLLVNEFPKLKRDLKLIATKTVSQENFEYLLLNHLSKMESKDIVRYLSSHQLNKWLNSSDSKIKDMAINIFGEKQSNSVKDRQKIINDYISCLSLNSSPVLGKEIFDLQCAICHANSNRKNNLGPTLSSLRGMSAEKLLVHILDPNRDIAPRYLSSVIETSNKEFIHGIITEAGPAELTIQLPQSIEIRLNRNEITHIKPVSQSIMPSNFESSITKKQMAHLISFIAGD